MKQQKEEKQVGVIVRQWAATEAGYSTHQMVVALDYQDHHHE